MISTSINADLSTPQLQRLAAGSTKVICQRSTGFNNIDLAEAARLGLTVARVSDNSPNSVAEFAWTLAMGLTRSLPRAILRTRSSTSGSTDCWDAMCTARRSG